MQIFTPGHFPRPHCIVIAARLHGEWIHVQYGCRTTWELPNGEIHPDESPLNAAQRILQETVGTVPAVILPVADFEISGESSNGALFYAELETVSGSLSQANISGLLIDAVLPRLQTFPDIHPQLFYEVQDYLNRQTSVDEFWDVLDENRQPVGRLHRRGDPLAPGEFHLVVQVWIQNRRGEFLLTRRTANKGNSHLWETVGGSAVAGDDSLSAAIREVHEETGIQLSPSEGTLLKTRRNKNDFCDVWRFRHEFELSQIIFQPGETCAAMIADRAKLQALRNSGRLVSDIPENV